MQGDCKVPNAFVRKIFSLSVLNCETTAQCHIASTSPNCFKAVGPRLRSGLVISADRTWHFSVVGTASPEALSKLFLTRSVALVSCVSGQNDHSVTRALTTQPLKASDKTGGPDRNMHLFCHWRIACSLPFVLRHSIPEPRVRLVQPIYNEYHNAHDCPQKAACNTIEIGAIPYKPSNHASDRIEKVRSLLFAVCEE